MARDQRPGIAEKFWRALRRRPGMSMRLAIGFAAVALTVIVANFITQRSADAAREHVRELLVRHEPLVRATESLAAAVSQYERMIVEEASRASPDPSHIELYEKRIVDSFDAYEQAARRFPNGEFFVPELRTHVDAFRASGSSLLQYASSRGAHLRAYWSRFDRFETQLETPQTNAARFAGAVFASESVLKLQRTLNAVRERVSTATTVASPLSLQNVIAAENAFNAMLKQHRADLVTFHGQTWVDEIAGGFKQLVAARRLAFDTNAAFEEASASFRDEGANAASLIVTRLVEPARRALADADRLAVDAAAKAERQLVWVSTAVMLMLFAIAVVTVSSVSRPVRALIDATRKLANGVTRTRVPRGGVRELDTLAGAFNRMAEQLEHAEAEVRANHAQLEAKVEERTRELAFLAHHDALTQLPNRRQLFSHLESAITRARQDESRFAVMFVDLDNFKTINDSLGHAFGDAVLQAVSERLQSHSAGVNAFSARFGGDEFTIVYEDVHTIDAVERLSNVLIEQFQRTLLVHGRELRLSVSVGASVYPDHADNPHGLLRAADVALFRAKELGRGCSSLFAHEMFAAAASRFKVEQALRRAVERGEFELVYQPEVCFETLQTQTLEALLRWRQPDGNVVAPGEFLDVAEQAGLSAEINDWALRTAVQAAALWQSGPWPSARVAVNISAQQLLSGDFVGRLDRLLKEHALPPECLEIELTENVLQTGATTIAALHRLRELGVSIALDDFGTGYSSLTSLERLPLTRVKIDRSLIASIDHGTRSPAIVRSIIGLCHSLGLQVTAEGVERHAQLGVLLRDRGIHVQGFLVARPLDAAVVPTFLSKAREYLEQLAREAPVSDDSETTSRLRVLRLTPNVRSARRKGVGEE